MRALQRSDWTKLMSMVPPTEIPFYDYRAAFAELIRKSNDESGDSADELHDRFDDDEVRRERRHRAR